MGASSSAPRQSIHNFHVKDNNGNDVNLHIYEGKVLLVVNVASQCGFTSSNYTELTELYSEYKDKGFEILAFPCNQFMKQEPGSSQDAEQYACTRFKAEFPIFQKVKVNGPDTAPVYKFLKSSKGGVWGSTIKWNFTKFLIDKDGHVIKRYGTATSPLAISVSLDQIFVISERLWEKLEGLRFGLDDIQGQDPKHSFLGMLCQHGCIFFSILDFSENLHFPKDNNDPNSTLK